jgi:PST family polysaccharide transporter
MESKTGLFRKGPRAMVRTANSAAEHRTKGSLGDRVTQGAVVGLGLSLVSKLLSLAAQWICAWYLIPEDFGQVSIVLSIYSAAQLFQSVSGIYLQLLRGKGRLLRDGIQGFYLSCAQGLVLMVAMMLAAPWIASAYGEPKLALLLILQALTLPLDSLGLVESVWLSRHMRFGSLNLASSVQSFSRFGFQILLVLCGAGVYSLVLCHPISVGLKVLALKRLSPTIPWVAPDLSRWPRLWIGALGWMFSAFMTQFSPQVFFLILSFGVSTSWLGIYAWGHGLAGQAAYLLSASLASIFIPAFASMEGDWKRQSWALRRSVRSLGMLLVPACVGLSLGARDLIELFFSARWLPAAPVISALALGFIYQPAMHLSMSLLHSQGRWPAAIVVYGIQAVLGGAVAGMVLLGMPSSWLAPLHAVSMAAGSLACLVIALQRDRTAWRGAIQESLVLGVLAGILWLPVGAMRGMLSMPPLLSLLLTCFVVGLLFAAVASTVLRSWATEWTTRLQRVWGARSGDVELGGIGQRPGSADHEEPTRAARGMT